MFPVFFLVYIKFDVLLMECCIVCVYGMQKQSKGKAARMQANLAGFELLAKMAEEPWYVLHTEC